jgi:hypothetical protein
MSTGPKVTLTITLPQAIALGEVIKAKFDDLRWQADQTDEEVADKPKTKSAVKVDEYGHAILNDNGTPAYDYNVPVLDDDGNPVIEDRSYTRRSRAKARQDRDDLSNLHYAVLGTYLRDER